MHLLINWKKYHDFVSLPLPLSLPIHATFLPQPRNWLTTSICLQPSLDECDHFNCITLLHTTTSACTQTTSIPVLTQPEMRDHFNLSSKPSLLTTFISRTGQPEWATPVMDSFSFLSSSPTSHRRSSSGELAPSLCCPFSSMSVNLD